MEYLMTGMALLAALIVAAGAVRWRQRRTETAAETRQTTLAACRNLLALIARLQQHRGLSSAWLGGDASFRSRLDEIERSIEQDLPRLAAFGQRESAASHPCLTRNDIALFAHHWAQLCQRLGQLSIEQSVAQHTMMIEQLLKWLCALGEARIEPLLPDALRARVRDGLVRLPAVTECLGQARALGMGVAARRACSAVVRVRLMFLITRAEALLDQIGDSAATSRHSAPARAAVQQMARVVRTQMLQASGITVSPQDYFAMSSHAIDAVFGWIDATVQELPRVTDHLVPAHAIAAQA